MTNVNKPIKRSKELVLLSREHHDGLLLCWKIRTGLKKEVNSERIKAYVQYFWDTDLKEHFRREEEYLFSQLPGDDIMKIKAMAQHNSIRELLTLLNKSSGSLTEIGLLEKLASELDDHIRFEERELFNHIEQTLRPDKLSIIGKLLDQVDGEYCVAEWSDEFWAKNE